MYLLYNLMDERSDPSNPSNPLIFGAGVLTGYTHAAARGNVTSLSPESDAFLDSNAGDYFPAFMRLHGYDHIVLYGKNEQWTVLDIEGGDIRFLDAGPYLGMNNIELGAAIESDFECTERRDMAMARITEAGENQVLCSGIMGGPKAIWARGGGGAKMGAMNLKAIVIRGKPAPAATSEKFRADNRLIGKQMLASSVVRNALKTVGTPFLYKPSRLLGAMGALNNQHTTWTDSLDVEHFDEFRPGMDGCFKCPVFCRPRNDMTPGAKGGWGAKKIDGLSGNRSYGDSAGESHVAFDEEIAAADTLVEPERGEDDPYAKGDGPEYVTIGKFGPAIGIKDPKQVLRLNNILNDLGLDSASTGSAIAWAMELYQNGTIDDDTTQGLDLRWGNYPVIEKLLFLTASRAGFGDVIADSAKAVATGKYPDSALDCRMAVKGLFQSDPHDSRILKAFALGLAVATRGMDHLRNRVTLEINARINDDPAYKTALYGGRVAAEPNSYSGKEYAVRRCEDVFAVGDAVGMCRFDTQLFNSPSLPGCEQFAGQLQELTGIALDAGTLLRIGLNITGLERMINRRLGLGDTDDTLPRRWFEEAGDAGPFKGERIDPEAFAAMRSRFYAISDLDTHGQPNIPWRKRLMEITTGFCISVKLPDMPGFGSRHIVLDQPVDNVDEVIVALKTMHPELGDCLGDYSLGVSINDQLIVRGEAESALSNGDHIEFVPVVTGG